MDIQIPKCALMKCLNKSKMNSTTFNAQIQATNINFRNQRLLVLHQNEPYVYIGINLVHAQKI